MASLYRQVLENWLKEQEVTAGNILDVGGSVSQAKDRLKKCECVDYKILDNEGEKDWHEKWTEPDYVWDMNEPLKSKYTSASGYFYWVNQPHGARIKLRKEFDAIFMFEVFEYIWNPSVALKNVHGLLNTGGKFYVTFPVLYSLHNPITSDSLRYYKAGIEKLMDYAGFKIEEMIPRKVTEGRVDLMQFYGAERMRYSKEGVENDQIFDAGYICVVTAV